MTAAEEMERAVFPLLVGPPKRTGETGRTGTAVCAGERGLSVSVRGFSHLNP